MKKLYTFTFALIVLLSMAMGAQALESKTIERQNGVSAFATWTEKSDDITTDTYLSVTETNDGTDIYLDMCTYGPEDYWSGKSGYISTEDDVFSIDKKLNSASLSEVKIDFYDWDTGEIMDTVTINADWTGTGDITKGSYTSMSKSGGYMWKSSDSSKNRDASVTGSINGCEPEISSYASLSNFKFAYMSMEK